MYKLLDGLKVLEVTAYWPDAVGQYLGDLGAEVIKVEPPKVGTLTRGIHGYEGLKSAQLLHWNRNKKSLALDLKTAEGQALFLELVAKVDFVVDGLRSGALEGFGAGYEALKRANPSIIYVAISGWGHTGPYRRLGTHGAGFDAYASVQPPRYRPDGLPDDPHSGMGEAHFGTNVGTLNAALAALAAYIRRTKTGEGARIDVAQGDAGVSSTFDRVFYQLNLGHNPYEPPVPSTRNQYYPTKDGKVIHFQSMERKFWNNFCLAVGRPDLVENGSEPGLLTDSQGNEQERRELAKILQTRTRAEWIQFFIDNNTTGAPVNSIADLVEDPQFLAREMTVEYADPELGLLKDVGTPIKLDGEKFEVRAAPQVGEHTVEVLEAFGVAKDRIGSLEQLGVIGTASATR